MKLREFDLDKDYKEVSKWWNDWNFPVIVPQVLPPIGYIVEEGDSKICAGWVYRGTGTPMGWLEWIVSNKHIEKKKRGEGLDCLLSFVAKRADDYGWILFSSLNNESLGKRLEKYGFNKTDTSMTNYIRGV